MRPLCWLPPWVQGRVRCGLYGSCMVANRTCLCVCGWMQFLRSLRHRNIVFFYGAGDLAAAPFLVTEFMPRGTLLDVLSSAEPLTSLRCVCLCPTTCMRVMRWDGCFVAMCACVTCSACEV